MEYTISQLASLSGVSTRTLRYYDEIELLKPARVNSNGYRIYGEIQVNKLQQILFYRQLDVSIEEIKKIMSSPDFDVEKALENHLAALKQRKEQIEVLMKNVKKTIQAMKGEIIMNDKEKFEGMKQRIIAENEKKYGKEVREKYGNNIVDAFNQKITNISKEQWEQAERLTQEIKEKLKEAMKTKNPKGELAKELCELHRNWLCIFWKEGTYSKEAHQNLAQMYVGDERFRSYYDEAEEGAAEFLKEAIAAYCEE